MIIKAEITLIEKKNKKKRNYLYEINILPSLLNVSYNKLITINQ